MKVLFISEYFYPHEKGGGEISAFLLAKEVAKKGIETHVLTSRFGDKKEETICKIKIHRLLDTGNNPGNFYANIKRLCLFEPSLLKELKNLDSKEDFDIIHCMNTSSISAAKVKRKINKKFILHVNGPVLFCPKGTLMYKDMMLCNTRCDNLTYMGCFLNSTTLGKISLNPLIKFNPIIMLYLRQRWLSEIKLMKEFDFFMPISSFMKEKLRFFAIEEEKIKIIYNLVEDNSLNKTGKKKDNASRLLFLGEYSRAKGALVFLEALKKIQKNYFASFYGDGELKDILISEIKKNKLRAVVNGKANHYEIPEIIEKHDIIIVPSFVGEAFSRTALEACLAGKTVVASRIGGITDIIKDKRTGYLFAPGDPEDLAKKIEKAMTDPIDRYKLKKIITEKFSNEKIINNVLNIYGQLSK